ncbi:hypothetical protein [Allorhodopirellula solitaria]|uniref:hypothetical protein n=1 Tax=Allorhodopirellula solitaria TaxID=2527987 RepID=UPI0011B5FDD6|nr:hypothetical protein [Allorhodopirellula solitaria]
MHTSQKWMKIQKRFFDKNTTHKINWHVVVKNREDKLMAESIFACKPLLVEKKCKWGSMDHSLSIRAMHESISGFLDNDDVLLIIDSDAFPIANIDSLIACIVEDIENIYGIQRTDNGDYYCHPAFIMLKQKTVRYLSGFLPNDSKSVWLPYGVRNRYMPHKKDAVGCLTYCIDRANLRWSPLLRTNVLDVMPVLFGVYGNLIYHHGCGSRHPTVDVHRVALGYSASDEVMAKEMTEIYRKISDNVFSRILSDDTFFEVLITDREFTPLHIN